MWISPMIARVLWFAFGVDSREPQQEVKRRGEERSGPSLHGSAPLLKTTALVNVAFLPGSGNYFLPFPFRPGPALSFRVVHSLWLPKLCPPLYKDPL